MKHFIYSFLFVIVLTAPHSLFAQTPLSSSSNNKAEEQSKSVSDSFNRQVKDPKQYSYYDSPGDGNPAIINNIEKQEDILKTLNDIQKHLDQLDRQIANLESTRKFTNFNCDSLVVRVSRLEEQVEKIAKLSEQQTAQTPSVPIEPKIVYDTKDKKLISQLKEVIASLYEQVGNLEQRILALKTASETDKKSLQSELQVLRSSVAQLQAQHRSEDDSLAIQIQENKKAILPYIISFCFLAFVFLIAQLLSPKSQLNYAGKQSKWKRNSFF